MSEKIHLLNGKFIANYGGNGVAASARNTFTVNTAVNEVSFDTTTNPNWYFIFNVGAFAVNFQARDNLRILSAGVYLPHGFINATKSIYLALFAYITYQDLSVIRTYIPSLSGTGTDSFIELPFANYEYALDIFVPFPDQTIVSSTNPVKMMLQAQITGGDVSMLNAPSASNGQTYTPIPFIKVLHTNYLTN